MAVMTLVCSVLLSAPVARAAEPDRVSGSDRLETAVAISQRAFPDGADTVYLARADVFADALAAGSLTDGPVLLVPSCGDAPDVVAEEVSRLEPAEVVALGGERAVCTQILEDVADDVGTDRLAGEGRTGTAVAIAARAFPDEAPTVYLANAADDAPDAVAAGSLTDGPILLVPSSGEPDDRVVGAIERLAPTRVVALGGAAAVGDDVLTAAAGERQTGRLAGDSRLDTAAAIAAAAFPDGAPTVYLARADIFVDAVAAGSLTDGPVLLVPTCGDVPDVVAATINDLGADAVVAIGGVSAICDQLLEQAATGEAPPPAPVCDTDPSGDVNGSAEPKADVRQVCAVYGDTLRLELRTAEPVDPTTDPGWTDNFTDVLFAIDTDGGQTELEEFDVNYGYRDGALRAFVTDPNTGGDIVCEGVASYDGTSYIAAELPPDCIGAPDSFLLYGSMEYDDGQTRSQDETDYPPDFEVARG